MSTPVKLRQTLLKDADKLVELYAQAAVGDAVFMRSVDEARREVWDTIKQIILQADDPVPMAKLTDGEITERVDAVLGQVAQGNLTPDEGKRLIGLLQAGFEITTLPALLEKLAEAERDSKLQ